MPRPNLLHGLVVLATTTIATAQTIQSIPGGTSHPSGRIQILGSGFGSGPQGLPPGQVRIGGRLAITTTWTETAIHAYVPEATTIGSVPVIVDTPSGSSTPAQLDVEARSGTGRVAWRFEVDALRPNPHGGAVGADGTLYIDDKGGRLYAIRPDGELLWVVDGNEGMTGVGAEGPVSLLPDGNIVFASNPGGPEIRIHAVDPQGNRLWTWSHISPAYVICAGPTVGPDGNIYASLDRAQAGSIGVFSLDPQGNLRWSNQGSPLVNDYGTLGHRIEFSDDAFFIAFDEQQVPGVNGHWLYGFEFDGTQRFSVTGVNRTGRPHVRADGSMVARWGFNSHLRSLDDMGNEQWTRYVQNAGSEPVLDPMGNAYIYRPILTIECVAPDGTRRWGIQGPQLGWPNFMGVSPDGISLIDGGRLGFGMPGWIRAYSTVDGADLWRVDLPREFNGVSFADVAVSGEPTFSPDSTRAYVPAELLGFNSANQFSFVYAMNLEGAVPFAQECRGASDCPCGNVDPSAGCANSTMHGSLLTVHGGSAGIAADDLVLGVTRLPANTLGILFMGASTTRTPLSDGVRCVAPGATGLHRFPVTVATTGGVATVGPGLASYSTAHFAAGAIDPGETWRFQFWYRDVGGACGTGANLSNSIAVMFQP